MEGVLIHVDHLTFKGSSVTHQYPEGNAHLMALVAGSIWYTCTLKLYTLYCSSHMYV